MKINVEKLEDIAKIIAGQSPISSYYNDKGEGYPFLQGKTDFGKLYPKARTWCTKPKKIAENRDILLSVRAPVGAVNIADTDVCIGRGICAIRANDKCHYKYLYYYLKIHEQQIQRYQTGSTFKSITVAKIKQLQIPLPKSLEEQIKIANLLTQVESLIAKREESIELLDELLRSSFLDMFGDPVLNKKGWETVKLDSITTKVTDGTHKTPIYLNEGIIFISAKNIKNGTINFENIKYISKLEHNTLSKRCNPEVGDILLTKSGSLGSSVVIKKMENPFSLFESLALIKFEPNIINPYFFNHFLNSNATAVQYRKMARGVAIRHLHLRDIKKLNVILPPKALQDKFATIVQQVEESKEKYQESLDELRDLFGSLSQKAFKGELELENMTI